jgi:hypothetical protein
MMTDELWSEYEMIEDRIVATKERHKRTKAQLVALEKELAFLRGRRAQILEECERVPLTQAEAENGEDDEDFATFATQPPSQSSSTN